MLAAAVRVDAHVKKNIGTVVSTHYRAARVPEELGLHTFWRLVAVFFVKFQRQLLKSIGRVAGGSPPFWPARRRLFYVHHLFTIAQCVCGWGKNETCRNGGRAWCLISAWDGVTGLVSGPRRVPRAPDRRNKGVLAGGHQKKPNPGQRHPLIQKESASRQPRGPRNHLTSAENP